MVDESQNFYCDYTSKLEKNNLHRIYHDTQYGFPVKDDNELFGRLILEINQAGLSWETILKKQNNFKIAYDNFNIEKIASYDKNDIFRLLNNAKIIRNKIKINSVIYNAQKVLLIKKQYGSFKNWLDVNDRKSLIEWIQLFKKTFKFTGSEITKEFLISTGKIKGAHIRKCPIFKKTNIK
ncbi:MAG: DNA-3-methyladenine glycosylase [Candidatus Marinimicrobia bacterium]|nr:DNA-3-methyladenine glycosylase [Candidatus Neomarinimicrobiota bacterium]